MNVVTNVTPRTSANSRVGTKSGNWKMENGNWKVENGKLHAQYIEDISYCR